MDGVPPTTPPVRRGTVVAFWNVKEEPLADDVVQLAVETDCDILATAETGGLHSDLAVYLQDATKQAFRHMTPKRAASGTADVHVWTRLTDDQFRAAEPGDRFEAFLVQTESPQPTLMVFAHLRSKVGRRPGREWGDTTAFGLALRAMEVQRGSGSRTVVVGDLNLHPFDDAMRFPEALGALPSRAMVSSQPQKRRDGVLHDRFYNPSWRFLSDANGPSGTHFWKHDGLGGNWYTLDQVLLRPDLIAGFHLPSLRIVTSIGGQDMVTPDGRIAKSRSDHLPITFALET